MRKNKVIVSPRQSINFSTDDYIEETTTQAYHRGRRHMLHNTVKVALITFAITALVFYFLGMYAGVTAPRSRTEVVLRNENMKLAQRTAHAEAQYRVALNSLVAYKLTQPQ